MKRKRILLCILCSVLLLFSMSALTVYAHPGGTDSNGGHRDRTTGEYHYHHGYEAHDHYDSDGDGVLDCPFDFDDQAGTNSGTNSYFIDKYRNPLPSSAPTLPDKKYPESTIEALFPESNIVDSNTVSGRTFHFEEFYLSCSFISVFVLILLSHLMDYMELRSKPFANFLLTIWCILGLVFLITTVCIVFPYVKWYTKRKAGHHGN